MMAIRATARAAALTLALAAIPALAASPALAQDQNQDQRGSPGEMAREGVEQLMNAIETFVHSLPMYGAPRIDEQGNIVIPRLDKDDPSQRTPERKPDNREPNQREPGQREPGQRDRAPNGDGGMTEI